ncbi:thrombospondin type 3 repeat-containing protein [Micromonospora humida]|uniref:thrombospondin type 3 repeat-containing protein n=1 Tax=Micromonospora humida TaxID=2809018 RepID=UPI0033EE6491
MSSYRDPILHGDVYPSEEEIDPTGVGLEPASAPPSAYPDRAGPTTTPTPRVAPGGAHSIVTHHLDGSTQVVTDLDGDGIADVVQFDLDGDGVPDITYLDSDRDGRLDTVLREPGARRP